MLLHTILFPLFQLFFIGQSALWVTHWTTSQAEMRENILWTMQSLSTVITNRLEGDSNAIRKIMYFHMKNSTSNNIRFINTWKGIPRRMARLMWIWVWSSIQPKWEKTPNKYYRNIRIDRSSCRFKWILRSYHRLKKSMRWSDRFIIEMILIDSDP